MQLTDAKQEDVWLNYNPLSTINYVLAPPSAPPERVVYDAAHRPTLHALSLGSLAETGVVFSQGVRLGPCRLAQPEVLVDFRLDFSDLVLRALRNDSVVAGIRGQDFGTI